jgi:tetratricopeptide (TPR) repeat protein
MRGTHGAARRRGECRGIAGAWKDLLSEALRRFQAQGEYKKASEAQYELGICYWRLGAFDEARVVRTEALTPLTESDVELKAKILVRRTLVEISENRYYDALNILKEAESVFESASDALKGRWHGQKGLVLRRLATSEGRADYFDKAIIEYTAPSITTSKQSTKGTVRQILTTLPSCSIRWGATGTPTDTLTVRAKPCGG